ncbi:TonB-dependent receptor [Alteromonadaceae bacterium BrNp21-10]|nr:TonB-dependent receptor [Alteromonadaceae bacterium BrNp21-10]
MIRRFSNPVPFWIIGLCLIMPRYAVAAGDISWHGFVAQGVIQASDTNFIEDDGGVSTKLTEIGLNTSVKLNDSLRLSGQAVYLNGGNRYPEGPRLDYLFLDWQAISKFDFQLNVHIGRFKNYHWLHSATRDVPHTRPSIVLPQSIYFDSFRDIGLGNDGIAILSTVNSDVGEWDINWSYGVANISKGQTKNLLGRGAQGNLQQNFDHKFSIFFRPIDSNWQFAVNIIDTSFNYHRGQLDALFDGRAEVLRTQVEFNYERDVWNISGEMMQEKTAYMGILYPGFVDGTAAQGGYIQGAYYFTSALRGIARIDIYDLDKNDRNGMVREQNTGGLFPAYAAYMDNVTLGVQWTAPSNWRIAAEVHRFKGIGRLAPVLSPDISNDKYWNLWAIQVMYWF